MIGWYVDAGYCRNKQFPGNLSDIVFTDFDRPWAIITFQNYSEYSGTDVEEFSNAIDAIIGEEQRWIYSPLVESYSSFPITEFIPSSKHAYPNLFNYVMSLPSLTSIYSALYFKSLKKLVVSGVGSVNRVYNVNEDGSLSTLSRDALCWMTASRVKGVTFASGKGKEDDFTKEETFNGFTITSPLKTPGKDTCSIEIYRAYSAITSLFVNNPHPTPDFDYIGPDNPYEPGGPSGPTDPDLPPGTFDDESDTIPDSSLPTISAANTGFTRIYNPTLSQVQALARYLWTDESVIETIWNHIKQFFENPMEAIIGFNLVPVPVPNGGTENFALMYIDTGVPMTVAANQFVDMDCGTLEVKRYYGSALDQSPYTKVSCFLPYIGTVNLNTDEVMGTTLQVKYRVDIVSGSCVAKIFVDGNCLYQYSGHCAITIPFSSADFSSYVSAAISVGKLAAAAITAGAGVAMGAGVAEASQQTNQVVTTTQVINTARNPSSGRQITTGTTTTVQTRESPADQSSTQASFSGLSPQNVANTVGAIMSSKPHIEHSGSFSGNSGYLGVRRPFLIIERPNMCMPANYQALNGFPAMITMELSTCKGFTRVQQVQLTGMGRATNPEQAEILELLKSGVIL